MNHEKRIALTALLVLTITCESGAQSITAPDSSTSSHTFWSRHNLSTAATAGLVGGMIVYGWGVWWKNDFGRFRFWNDPNSFYDAHLAVDKAGHMYTGYFIFQSTNTILRWGEHDRDAAFWWAAGISSFHALVVEVGDGFTEYGFDYQDMLSNWAGVGFGILQQRVPVLSNFELKWSLYYPLNKHSFKVNDLYDYHFYWLSAKVDNLLPESLQPFWPDWLQIAVGYGAADNVSRREFAIGFDYNLEMIPVDGTDINLLKKLLNLIHLPAPGVKFSRGHSPEFQLLLLN